MKLVETDAALAVEDVAEVPRPPRPEHRKAYVSLFLTSAVLIATVAVVYILFPKRNHEVIGEAVEEHRAPGPLELERPSHAELTAWTIGVLARPVPWPSGPGVEVVGVRRRSILRKEAAVARLDVDGTPVTMVVMVPWDAPPRTIRKTDGDVAAVWWRQGPWTFIAAGPTDRADGWRSKLGAP